MPAHSAADTSSAPSFLIFICIDLLLKSCTHSRQRSRVRGGGSRLPQQSSKLKAEEEAKKAAEEAAASGTEQPKENKVTKIASGFLGVVVLIALAAGGIFYAFAKQKQKKQAEKEALDPDANYTEDKGDFEIPTEDEPEEPGEEDTEPI